MCIYTAKESSFRHGGYFLEPLEAAVKVFGLCAWAAGFGGWESRGGAEDFRFSAAGLQATEDFLGATDDLGGQSGEAGDLNAVAAVRRAGDDAVQEDDLVVPLADGDGEVFRGGVVAAISVSSW